MSIARAFPVVTIQVFSKGAGLGRYKRKKCDKCAISHVAIFSNSIEILNVSLVLFLIPE